MASTGCRASRVCGSSAPGSAGSAFCRSTSTGCTRTIVAHRARPARRGGAGRPPLRPAADGQARLRRRPPAPRSASTTTKSDIDGLAAAIEAAREMFRDDGSARALSGHHPRPRPPSAQLSRRSSTRPIPPRATTRLCGDRVTVYPDARRRPDRRCQLRGARLRDLDRGGLADDRGAEGQDRRRGAGIVRAVPRAGDRRRRGGTARAAGRGDGAAGTA